jgi:hypothetical protein
MYRLPSEGHPTVPGMLPVVTNAWPLDVAATYKGPTAQLFVPRNAAMGMANVLDGLFEC